MVPLYTVVYFHDPAPLYVIKSEMLRILLFEFE